MTDKTDDCGYAQSYSYGNPNFKKGTQQQLDSSFIFSYFLRIFGFFQDVSVEKKQKHMFTHKNVHTRTNSFNPLNSILIYTGLKYYAGSA